MTTTESGATAEDSPEILRPEVQIATPGPRTVEEWPPVVVGHLAHHRDQLHDVPRSRDRLPARFDRTVG